jgi:hypothetical protein
LEHQHYDVTKWRIEMAQDGVIPSSKRLDDLVREATTQDESISDAFERMKAELHSHLGMIVPEPSENERLYHHPAAPAPAMPESDPNVPHHFGQVLYPRGNDRVEVWASSQEELDRKIAAVMAMYRQ